jgi:hypothetical protein
MEKYCREDLDFLDEDERAKIPTPTFAEAIIKTTIFSQRVNQ